MHDAIAPTDDCLQLCPHQLDKSCESGSGVHRSLGGDVREVSAGHGSET